MAGPDFQALAQPGIRGLRAYDPGHDIVALRRRFPELLEAGSNESPFGPSASAREALLATLSALNRYPDPLGAGLRDALARRHGLARAQIVLGNGSHELLMLLGQVFAGPGAGVLASQFGFAVYAIAAKAAGAGFVEAKALPAESEMPRGHDLKALAALVGGSTRLVYLANPNNPTGTWFSLASLEQFLLSVPRDVLVVVDEAYIEYSSDPELASAIPLLASHPNLVVTRTFSKAYGLAGLRAGYACAHPSLLDVLERARESFNVNACALAACEAALADVAHLETVRSLTVVEREWLAAGLRTLGVDVSPSQTNFLLADFGRDAAAIEANLLGRGIVLRPMTGYGLPACLRMTVGTRADNERLLKALGQVLG